MSDPHATPDPMDKAYAEAEAVLSDEAARAARRARVLAAVAAQAETPAAAARPGRRTAAWGGWLAAASIGGLSVFVATQIYQPDATAPPAPPAAPTAPAAPEAESPAVAASPPPAAQTPARPAGEARPPATGRSAVAQAPRTESRIEEVAVTGARIPDREAQGVPVMRVPPPLPPPSPPPPSAFAGSLESRARAPAQPRPAAVAPPAAARSDSHEIGEMVVVTAERRKAADAAAHQAERLRQAAAEGESREISRLLARGVPVDAADDDGETALMKAVQAHQPTAAALLRRRGASLDLKNRAGESARDMAAAIGDAELNRALGLAR